MTVRKVVGLMGLISAVLPAAPEVPVSPPTEANAQRLYSQLGLGRANLFPFLGLLQDNNGFVGGSSVRPHFDM